MTHDTASTPRFTSLQEVEHAAVDHGATERPAAAPARRSGFAVWRWLPREVLRRGGTVTRDDERAYRDLQAAADRADWR